MSNLQLKNVALTIVSSALPRETSTVSFAATKFVGLEDLYFLLGEAKLHTGKFLNC